MSNNFAAITANEYHTGNSILLNTIDKGFFAKVRLARHILTGTEVAVKITSSRAIFQEMVSVVQHCHQRGIVYQDRKTENIPLDGELNIKLTDFGSSTEFSDRKQNIFYDTVSYMAPEILQLQPYDGPKVDVWSLRVI
ncbi:hypothetical protein HJG60_010542 [Phyllostomus discolor]|uniref:non-specific serine/threonine protein kinase n=1 Tax=Phyllostomus discolor TaxID=89673 RepID=A0A834EHJ6_9CHIR|nr:hypothetical protein HJG60_010542 [Phyllostomus discolor]